MSGSLGKWLGDNKTVIRGGYARIYGRLNGVDLLLVPLLGPGIAAGGVLRHPTITGTCAGAGGATPPPHSELDRTADRSAYRRPPKLYPSRSIPGAVQNGILNAAAADGSLLDPNREAEPF